MIRQFPFYILVVILLTGCAVTKSKSLTTKERDTLVYHWPRELNRSALPVVYTRTVKFVTVEQVLEWSIEEAPTPLGPWNTVWLESPGLWIGAGEKTVLFNSQLEIAFYRAAVRNKYY